MSHSEISDVLNKQKAAFMASHPEDADVRIDRLKRLKALLLENADRIIDTEYEDFGGRCPTLTRAADILGGVAAVEYNIANVVNWMAPEVVDLPEDVTQTGAHAVTEYQPLGVVGVLVPWNGPFLLSIIAAAGVLAAGNRMMLKPSELAPKSSALLAELFTKYFEQDEVHVIEGEVDVASSFVSQPFDHILFTGSTRTGRKVLQAAAANLVPVTLELGGKSPVIFGKADEANRAIYTKRLAHSKLLFGGQVCVTPDYLMVPGGQATDIAQELIADAEQLYPTISGNQDYTAIINDANVQRLNGLVDDARDKGATILVAGEGQQDSETGNGRRYPLHIILNPTDDMAVMDEEIFGPILPVLEYQSLAEAVAFINARPRPLSAYFYGDDEDECNYLSAHIWTGSMCVNDSLTQIFHEAIPFGGVGASGMGRYRGIEGFRTFSNQRPIFYQTANDEHLAPMRPPHADATKEFLKQLTDQLKSE